MTSASDLPASRAALRPGGTALPAYLALAVGVVAAAPAVLWLTLVPFGSFGSPMFLLSLPPTLVMAPCVWLIRGRLEGRRRTVASVGLYLVLFALAVSVAGLVTWWNFGPFSPGAG